MIITLKNDKIEVKINSLGAEIFSVLGEDNHEYIWTGKPWTSHAPVLFPLCGRLLNSEYTYGGKKYHLDCHGFAPHSEFKVLEMSDSKVVLNITESEETLAVYPFKFSLTVEYSIEGNKLFTKFYVENKDEKVLPYMMGWHPGFVLEGDAPYDSFSLEFEKEKLNLHPLANGPFLSDKVLEFPLNNKKYILNEEEIYKMDTLIFTEAGNSVVLSGKDAKHSAKLSWSDNNKYFCIWKSIDSAARFICLEPWSDVPADGLTDEVFETRKMSRLGVGESETYSYSIEFN